MDLNYLKKGARQFSYQLSKFYPEDETPINYYVCKNQVIVLSSRRIFVYYYDQFIDYIGDYFGNLEIMFGEGFLVDIIIKGRKFNIEFEKEKDIILFKKYYEKYSR